MATFLDGRFTDPSHQFFSNKSGAVFKSSPKAPAAPDPNVTAAAQTAQNKETAWYNAMLQNINQVTPYGNLTYEQSGTVDNPKWTSTISLSPEQQAILDKQQSSDLALANMGADQLARIQSAVSSPYSFGGLGDAPSAQSVDQLSQQGQDALMARLNPQFGYDEEALRTRLINQGIGQGSEAYRREMESFNQAKNDARTQAVLQGANYGGALQNQALARRQQAITEYNTERNAPLNEYIGLTSGTQIQNPSFSSGGNSGIAPVDYAGLVNQNYQNQMGQYNSKVASNNSTQSSLMSLGGSLLGTTAGSGIAGSAGWLAMLSDERAKENIIPIGQENGHNIYEFSYIGKPERYIGVMAQEVEKTNPEAVIEIDGIKRVNYDAIGVKMRRVS